MAVCILILWYIVIVTKWIIRNLIRIEELDLNGTCNVYPITCTIHEVYIKLLIYAYINLLKQVDKWLFGSPLETIKLTVHLLIMHYKYENMACSNLSNLQHINHVHIFSADNFKHIFTIIMELIQTKKEHYLEFVNYHLNYCIYD